MLPHSPLRRVVWAFVSGVSGHQGSNNMTLIFLQVEDDVEMYQMPKQSQRDDLAKAMIGGRSNP